MATLRRALVDPPRDILVPFIGARAEASIGAAGAAVTVAAPARLQQPRGINSGAGALQTCRDDAW